MKINCLKMSFNSEIFDATTIPPTQLVNVYMFTHPKI